MTIAFFDSGAGGLSVLNTALNFFPKTTKFIYYADTDHVPYGEQDPELVKNYISEGVKFLLKKNASALIVACNTATSLAIKELRQQQLAACPIFGMEPAIKLAVNSLLNPRAKVLVTGTKITIHSPNVKQLINDWQDHAQFDLLALGELVNLVEAENSDPQIVQNYLTQQIPHPESYQAVVLGCTHFSFFIPALKEFFGPQTIIVDGNLGTIKHVVKQLNLNTAQTPEKIPQPKIDFYFSGRQDATQEAKYRRLLARLATQ